MAYEAQEVVSADLPVIAKPRSSAGSKNMSIFYNRKQIDGFLEQHMGQADQYVFQEYIDAPDDEFTCAVWRCSDALRICVMRRRLQGGMTGWARLETQSMIEESLGKIVDIFRGDIFINVQLRMKNGLPYIFEINPRFSSTLMMRHKVGFQDFRWTLEYVLEGRRPPEWRPEAGTVMIRLSDEKIIPAGI